LAADTPMKFAYLRHFFVPPPLPLRAVTKDGTPSKTLSFQTIEQTRTMRKMTTQLCDQSLSLHKVYSSGTPSGKNANSIITTFQPSGHCVRNKYFCYTKSLTLYAACSSGTPFHKVLI